MIWAGRWHGTRHRGGERLTAAVHTHTKHVHTSTPTHLYAPTRKQAPLRQAPTPTQAHALRDLNPYAHRYAYFFLPFLPFFFFLEAAASFSLASRSLRSASSLARFSSSTRWRSMAFSTAMRPSSMRDTLSASSQSSMSWCFCSLSAISLALRSSSRRTAAAARRVARPRLCAARFFSSEAMMAFWSHCAMRLLPKSKKSSAAHCCRPWARMRPLARSRPQCQKFTVMSVWFTASISVKALRPLWSAPSVTAPPSSAIVGVPSSGFASSARCESELFVRSDCASIFSVSGPHLLLLSSSFWMVSFVFSSRPT
mmetsp:Transcript_9211/g.26927  ORF Transcript_9211/g.26927 Transcript_9211/m.26927 type:complete len:312 (+) Transcript_9211:37-972(+)